MGILSKKPMDEMMRREQGVAYKLLAPTLIIIFLLAIYPLGSAFLKSFTNETFASDEPTKVVWLGNYTQLFGITIGQLPPKENYTITAQTLEKLKSQDVPQSVLAQLEPLLDKTSKGFSLDA